MPSEEQKVHGMHLHYQSAIVGPGSGGGETGVVGLIRNFTNNNGSNLVLGDVVGYDTTGDSRVKKTTTLGDPTVAGVVAEAGPFAHGDLTPVLIIGFHASVKVTGAIARGDYLQASNTDGSAETIATPDVGTFAKVVDDDVAGFAACVVFDRTLSSASVIANFTDLGDVPASYIGFGGEAVAVKGDESGLEFVPFPSGKAQIVIDIVDASVGGHSFSP